jgi:glycerol-3-phosphate O-acyltransferase/dihydroxyacetone phosphate acyltransferase
VRRFFRALFSRALRVFFKRIEIDGMEKVPREERVIFVANHPNSLVDPLLLLCFAPRPVSFLAKAPLFRIFAIGRIVRAFDSIPVYRKQDPGTDLSRNRETFESARSLLARGGTLALFPEGASHDSPMLLPMKTGAARIALGAAARAGGRLWIVPTGLYYTRKYRFRSDVLMLYGSPVEVVPAPLESDGEPPAPAVRALTSRLGDALSALTLQAESARALALVRRAEKIFVEEGPGTLAEELSLRQRFVAGYRALSDREPRRLEDLARRIDRFDAERREAGLSLETLSPHGPGPRGVALLIFRNLGALLLAPFALVGAIVHYPAYRLTGLLVRRVARHTEDAVATAKVGLATLLFPATWLAAAAAAWRLAGPPAAAAAVVILPFCGWAAIRTGEALETILARAWALAHLAFSRTATRRLIAQRELIRGEILDVAASIEGGTSLSVER